MKDNTAEFNDVSTFRDAAIADGWLHEPTYKESEPESSACSLMRDGWNMSVMTRPLPPTARYKYSVSVNIWAPDGLCVDCPLPYDFAKLVEGTTTCSACKATNVKTVRYSFAGRCCEKCLPDMRAKHEQRGWCD